MHVESTGVSGVPGGLSGLGGARRGGGAGLCAICKVPTGVIRSRALQSLRDLNASQRWRCCWCQRHGQGQRRVVVAAARESGEGVRGDAAGRGEWGARGRCGRRRQKEGQQGSEASTRGDVRALFVSAVGKGAFARSAQGGASARTGGKGASAGSA